MTTFLQSPISEVRYGSVSIRLFALFVVFIVAFVIRPTCGFSQSNAVDSLQQKISTMASDTNKVNAQNDLSRLLHQTGAYSLSRKISEEAKKLATQLNFETGISTAYLNIGITYFYEGNLPEAMKVFQKALAINKKINNPYGLAKSYNNIGLVDTYSGRYQEAIESHKKSLEYSKLLNDSMGVAKSNNNLGIVYEESGAYPAALECYFNALKIMKSIGDDKGIADAYFNTGHIYNIQKNTNDAIQSYRTALEYYTKVGFKQGIALCYLNLAIKFKEQEKDPEAFEYTTTALKIFKEIGDKRNIATSSNFLGMLQTEQKDYTTAIINYKEGLDLFKQIGDLINVATSYYIIGDAHKEMKQYAEAIANYRKSIQIADSIGATEPLIHSHWHLAETYELSHNYKNAYIHLKHYAELNDSVFSESKSKLIAELKTQYETELKDQKIDLLSKENQIRTAQLKKQTILKYALLGGVFSLALILAVAIGYYRVRNKLKLQSLRTKIASDLHDDVGSTLSSIAIFSDIASRQSSEISPMLEKIGESSRVMLETMADIVWTINPDSDQFENILLRMRSFAYELLGARKIEFEFDADDALNQLKLPMDVRKNLYLIFKEATNNLVKHGNASKAYFTIKGNNNHLNMIIRDNGNGFDTDKDSIRNGLKNMRRRAEEIGGKLLIESEFNKGTTIELDISLS